MSDDLDLRGIDQSHEPDPQFRAALHSRLAAIVTGTDPGSVTRGARPGNDRPRTSERETRTESQRPQNREGHPGRRSGGRNHRRGNPRGRSHDTSRRTVTDSARQSSRRHPAGARQPRQHRAVHRVDRHASVPCSDRARSIRRDTMVNSAGRHPAGIGHARPGSAKCRTRDSADHHRETRGPTCTFGTYGNLGHVAGSPPCCGPTRPARCMSTAVSSPTISTR